jgi:hypothetical protein
LFVSSASPAPGLAASFTLIIRELQAFLAHRMFMPLGIRQRDGFTPFGLLWKRLERLTAQFATLVALVAEGGAALSPPPPKPIAPSRTGPRSWSPDPLSRRAGWLIVLLGAEVIELGIQLKHLFATPDFAALLNAAPEVASLLRPLCRTLCIPVPALPPRPVNVPAVIAPLDADPPQPNSATHVSVTGLCEDAADSLLWTPETPWSQGITAKAPA